MLPQPLGLWGRSLGVVYSALILQRYYEFVCCIPVSPGCSWMPEKCHDILQHGLNPPELALPGELQQGEQEMWFIRERFLTQV